MPSRRFIFLPSHLYNMTCSIVVLLLFHRTNHNIRSIELLLQQKFSKQITNLHFNVRHPYSTGRTDLAHDAIIIVERIEASVSKQSIVVCSSSCCSGQNPPHGRRKVWIECRRDLCARNLRIFTTGLQLLVSKLRKKRKSSVTDFVTNHQIVL